MADHRDANGKDPLLDPLPPPRPLLREVPRMRPGASIEELARGYATVATGYNQHLPGIYAELDAFRAAINTLPERLALAVRVGIERQADELRGELRRNVQREVSRLPSLTEYDPDMTPAGGIKVAPEAWSAIQQRIAGQDQALANLRHQLEVKEAERRGADHALEELAKASERRHKKLSTIWPIVAGVAAALAWAAAHFHLLP